MTSAAAASDADRAPAAQGLPLRNLSIIAHVDHGKTTLVDAMLRQAGLLAASADPSGEADRVMDNMDLERERGVTIMAKHTALHYKGVKLNLVDTPGHADFGGEVERSLVMVDGVVLLVDASEGPLPQTRFVLEKALARGLTVIVVINKVDRHDARPQEVLDEVYDLFIDLGSDDVDFPVVYAIGRDGVAGDAPDAMTDSLAPLMDCILEHLPPPPVDPDGAGRFQAVMLGYDDYVGRLALGRVDRGELVKGQRYMLCTADAEPKAVRLSQLFAFEGLQRMPVDRAPAGELVAIAGSDAIAIGDTLCHEEAVEPLERITVEEPTVAIQVGINDGPFSGKSGDKLTSRQILARLEKETLHNVSIRVSPGATTDRFTVAGRGELQLGILVEQMRREGFELVLSRPEVIEKEIGGKILEPYEKVTIEVADSMIGAVTELLSPRAGRMLEMDNRGHGRVRMIFRIPSRGLIGLRSAFLTRTRGEGIMYSLLDGYDSRAGNVARRPGGALVADRSGKVTGYAAEGLQARGTLFVAPGDEVYEGMIVGEHNRSNDLNVNIVRPRKLTNMRAASADELVVLDTARKLTLEEAIEWIDDDELVEVTPDAIRLRKKALAANRRSVKRTS